MTMTRLARLAAVAAISFAAPARAQMDESAHDRHRAELDRIQEQIDAGRRPGSRAGPARQHDGFYFRADSGVGYLSLTLPLGGQASYTGLATLGALHVGGTVQDRALVGIQAWAASLSNPTLRTPSRTTRLSGAQVGALGVGPELTVYFMPSNLYVSSAVGVTWLTLSEEDGPDRSSRAGLGARAAVGCEWWLTPKWGLGLAVALSFSSNRFDVAELGGSIPFQAWSLGAVLSATYN